MLLIAGLLLRILAFGTQVVPVHGLKFNFTADVEQCKPFTVSFAGSSLDGIPSFLSMIPVNSTAISIPLPDPSVVSTGITLTFLPFPAGSNFLASLDDSTGENLISVSDLKRVLPSSTDDSSCVAPQNLGVAKRFTISAPISQCEEFTINYDTSAVSRAPIVRLYSPKGSSFLLNSTSDNATVGTATYMMNFGRGKELILLMEDGDTIRETSPLMTVLGDTSSRTDCLKRNTSNTKKSTSKEVNDGNPVVGRAAIIGGATGGSAVVLIGLCMAIFIVRDRRRRRKIQDANWLPSLPLDDEKGSSAQAQFPKSTNETVNNPAYTSRAFLSPTRSNYARGSMSSWAQVVPEDQRYPANPSPSLSKDIEEVQRTPDPRVSIQSLDIEGMLNMATLQSERPSRKNSEATILGPPSVTISSPTFLGPATNPRHFRKPSDVPVGPESMAFSGYSMNPFEGHQSITPSFLQGNLNDGLFARSPGSATLLPASPTDRQDPNRDKILPSASRRSSLDWYGTAR